MAITHLDCVQVEAPDPSEAAEVWERLLGRRSAPCSAGVRIGLANSGLEIVAGAEAGLRGPVFAGRGPGDDFPRRGVPSALRDADPAEAAPLCSGVDPRAAAVALDHVVIRSVDLDGCLEAYTRLGLRLALDRTFPERGVRLVFFRFGQVTLELSGRHPPDLPDPVDPEGETRGAVDSLWGLAWRVPSIEAARRRIESAGFGITEFRPGHKAGTRVFTVVDAPAALPTLIIEDPSRRDAAGDESATPDLLGS